MGIAESTGLPQPALDILVNDKKNIQRKGSVTGKKQEFINLWTSLLSRTHAGNTSSMPAGRSIIPVHPRVCGEHKSLPPLIAP